MAEAAPTLNAWDEILDFLVSSPTPEQIIAYHPSAKAQQRLSELLQANRNGTLTDAERAELDDASYLNHLFIRLKARARLALQES